MSFLRCCLAIALASLHFFANAQTPGASEQLLTLLDAYVEESLRENPLSATYIGDNRYNDRFADPISPASVQTRLDSQRSWLRKIEDIDPAGLSASERLYLESFRHDRHITVEGFRFPAHYLALDQTNGWQIEFPAYASGSSIQPFKTVQDYDNFVGRAVAFARWLDSAIAAMREGAAKGYTLPRHIVEKMLPQLDDIIVDEPENNLFYSAVKAMPDTFSSAERRRIEERYRELIKTTLNPAYQRLRTFLQREYLPLARTTVGYGDLPNGQAWYAWEIARNTTLPLSAAEIHETGLREVARIRAEMEAVMARVGFGGDLPAFFAHLKTDERFFFPDEAALLAAYQRTAETIRERLPRLFDIAPRADFEIRPVEPFRAASAAGASYQDASQDGSRPGIFYINTYNLHAQPRFGAQTLTLHEALPGHFFQGALQLENASLPRYRRYNGYTVYDEGWALYAESLGPELGLFRDPYDWYGRLNDEQLRAMRLVVDTGLHALGWSRQRAVDYMLENSSLAESDVESEVDRYIVWPGQALAYKTGDLHLQALRRHAEKALGEHFDIRAFHRQLLLDGPLPMPVLERKVEAWIDSHR